MKLKTLTTAIALTLPMTGAFAAGMDRSGQSIGAFLQPNNYFEAGLSALTPDVTGVEAGTFAASGKKIDNMASDYLFGNVAVKLQPTELLSFGVIADQPFGAAASYQGDNAFVSNSSNTVLPQTMLDGMAASLITKNTDAKFASLTSADIIGLAAQKQAAQAGVALNSPTGQTIINTLTQQYATAAGKNAIDTAVKAGVTTAVTDAVKAKIAGANTLVGKGNTHAKVTTNNITFLFGLSPNKNITVYGGPVYQNVQGQVSLRGQAVSVLNGYDADIPSTDAWGWLAGAAYQIPEIALKASLTYRSKIEYDVNIAESISTLSALGLLDDPTATDVATRTKGSDAAKMIAQSNGTSKITTPQSVNLDLQSGIMANTVAFANVRWVNWKDFAVRPHKFGLLSNTVGDRVGRPTGFDLISYADDQWSVNAGVGRKLNDKWAGNVSVGWDSGAGELVTALGPSNGYWNVGAGIQYSPAPNYFVSGGAKYFWLGDAKGQTGSQATTDKYTAEFSDNNAIAYGLKLGYRF